MGLVPQKVCGNTSLSPIPLPNPGPVIVDCADPLHLLSRLKLNSLRIGGQVRNILEETKDFGSYKKYDYGLLNQSRIPEVMELAIPPCSEVLAVFSASGWDVSLIIYH